MAHSACPEVGELREVYEQLYGELEAQVETLRKRLLIIAGYPVAQEGGVKRDVSLSDMMNAAEKIEAKKLSMRKSRESGRRSNAHEVLVHSARKWSRNDKGEPIVITTVPWA